MVHKRKFKDDLAWKKSLREVADNPDWIFTNLDAIEKELQTKNHPDLNYLRSKVSNVNDWFDEIEKFHFKKTKKK